MGVTGCIAWNSVSSVPSWNLHHVAQDRYVKHNMVMLTLPALELTVKPVSKCIYMAAFCTTATKCFREHLETTVQQRNKVCRHTPLRVLYGIKHKNRPCYCHVCVEVCVHFCARVPVTDYGIYRRCYERLFCKL